MPFKKRILIVEEDPSGEKVLLKLLDELGHDVVQVNTGDQALDYLKGQTPELAIIDVLLSDMDGWQLCRMIRGDPRTRFVPMLLLTGDESPEVERMSMEVGADEYLKKPFLPDELVRMVEGLLFRNG